MSRATQERFLVLDDKLRMISPRDYLDVPSAILAANALAPWPVIRGWLVVRSNYDAQGVKIGEGRGRIAATREEGRWSGPDVEAGRGYLVALSLESAHERRHNSAPGVFSRRALATRDC